MYSLQQTKKCFVFDAPEPINKNSFLKLVFLNRCKRLLETGRQVFVVGDLNVTANPIDSCDPGDLEDFWKPSHRQWIKDMTKLEGGLLVDTFRQVHPNR